MINLYKLHPDDPINWLGQHRDVIPRNWDMRIQRVFSQLGLDDYHALVEEDWYMLRYVEHYDRDFAWGKILQSIYDLWKSHRGWTNELQRGRVEEAQIHQCEVCGVMFIAHFGNLIQPRPSIWGERKMCSMCQNDNWGCEVCGSMFFMRGNHYVSHLRVCEDCYQNERRAGHIFMCSSCGGPYFEEDGVTIRDRWVCTTCADERQVNCVECGDMMLDGVDRIFWQDDEPFCRACHNEVAVVAAYDHFVDKPPFLTVSGENIRPDTLLFGLEFEIEDDWNNNEVLEYHLGKRCLESVPKGWGYCKHDGSMFRGVEYVTHPMTPLFYKSNRKDWDKVLTKWKEAGFRTDQWDDDKERYNCGLHMHLSKDAFTSGHLYKFVRFFYKIHLRKLVQQIAQRDSNEFAKWRNDDYRHGAKLAKEKKNVSGDRYSVINLIGGHWHENHRAPAKTVEFRLFQGTLEPAILHKNVEFILSVFYFTRDYSITHITEKNYLRFLGQTKNRWRYLTDFLRKQLRKEI